MSFASSVAPFSRILSANRWFILSVTNKLESFWSVWQQLLQPLAAEMSPKAKAKTLRMGQSGQSRRSFGERLPGRGLSPPVSFTSQMVFYIEACESGSMMRHLPNDINGRWWKPWPLSQAG